MRTLIIVAVLSPIALMRSCQCGLSTPSATVPARVTTPATSPASPAAARLSAALAIAGNEERDGALAKVATDAAAQADASIATQAVDAIASVNTHDETAARAALSLSKSQPAAAGELARKIHSNNLRDATLAKIAKGEAE
jgi:hypothetical protein